MLVFGKYRYIKGFTIAEILIVMIILAILTSLIIPQWLNYQKQIKFNDAVETMHQVLLNLPIAQNNTEKKLFLSKNTAPATFQLIKVADETVLETYSFSEINASLRFFDEVNYVDTTFIPFNTSGFIKTNTPYIITFSNSNKNQAITILFTGKIVIGSIINE